ncbi:hypothetical protein H5410_008035 [Solanum commersonii]|uniref:Uncharacterized protein n=1 Tax=Solanum commersonii TaxID=4109 RepID=A0A9J6AEI1_SOLCO|nr:hypothetical protein H5410_008035 [Solanum commersonii]
MSIKSDVFSFGVLVTEILGGERNTCLINGEYVGNATKLQLVVHAAVVLMLISLYGSFGAFKSGYYMQIDVSPNISPIEDTNQD